MDAFNIDVRRVLHVKENRPRVGVVVVSRNTLSQLDEFTKHYGKTALFSP